VICLAQDGDQRWVFMNTNDFLVLMKLELFLTTSKLLYFEEGFTQMNLGSYVFYVSVYCGTCKTYGICCYVSSDVGFNIRATP